MPVIQLSLNGLLSTTKSKATEKEILDSLPYLGLDLEGREGDTVSVEYSPNRPDFSSEAGIARSLVGLLGIELGTPKYGFPQGGSKITVEDDEIRSVRPFVFGMSASINVTDDLIKQLITMQEDLTNGIGRRRSKVAIGIHNAEAIKAPIRYFATRDKSFSFVPLYGTKPETISTILGRTVQGRQYAGLVSSGVYPLLEDSDKNILSMPPIINGELTRLKPGIRQLFIDVTATEKSAGDGATAIMAAMLSDSGGKVEMVLVEDSQGHWTPDMTERRMRFDLDLTNRTLGLNLSLNEARSALERSRFSLDSEEAVIPRFRMDMIHPVDLVEEVALGYGVAKFTPEKTESSLTGSINPENRRMRRIIDVMVGLGAIEVVNLSLTNKREADLYSGKDLIAEVEDAKSENYEYLKAEVIPSLLSVLGSNTHEEYPQKIFEQASVFKKSVEAEAQLVEEQHLGMAIAESSASFSAAKSLLDALLGITIGADQQIKYEPKNSENGVFASGRTASILLSKKSEHIELGRVGEISPDVLEKVGLKVPVAGFEINLEHLLRG